MKTRKSNPAQLCIYDLLKQAEGAAVENACPRPGSCDIDTELRAALFVDLKHAQDETGRELSRYDVAARMSELTGEEVTYSQINNWTADSHREHRFPANLIAAFCQATGGRRAIEVLVRRSGLFALPGPEALRAEIRRIDETIKHAQKQKRKRELLLEEVEK